MWKLKWFHNIFVGPINIKFPEAQYGTAEVTGGIVHYISGNVLLHVNGESEPTKTSHHLSYSPIWGGFRDPVPPHIQAFISITIQLEYPKKVFRNDQVSNIAHWKTNIIVCQPGTVVSKWFWFHLIPAIFIIAHPRCQWQVSVKFIRILTIECSSNKGSSLQKFF